MKKSHHFNSQENGCCGRPIIHPQPNPKIKNWAEWEHFIYDPLSGKVNRPKGEKKKRNNNYILGKSSRDIRWKTKILWIPHPHSHHGSNCPEMWRRIFCRGWWRSRYWRVHSKCVLRGGESPRNPPCGESLTWKPSMSAKPSTLTAV